MVKKLCLVLCFLLCFSSMAFVEVSDAEIELLAKVIMAEAGGESYDGMLAVGTVVMNRVESPDFPDTVKGVLKQKNQFAKPKAKYSEEAMKAALETVEGKRVFPANVLMFQKKKTDIWHGMEWYCTVGCHNFYAKVEETEVLK